MTWMHTNSHSAGRYAINHVEAIGAPSDSTNRRLQSQLPLSLLISDVLNPLVRTHAIGFVYAIDLKLSHVCQLPV